MPFGIKQTIERVSRQSGLALVALLSRTRYYEHLNALAMPKNRDRNLLNSAIAVFMVGLLCLGKKDFSDI